jgi:DNA transposition AAA+ family ATPase/DNA-binding XRE family transcriptional regulator
MELSEKNKIKEAIKGFCITKGVSKNELATIADVSPATLSNIDYERWDLLSDEILLKVYKYVRPGDWVLIETDNFRTIQKICSDAQGNNKMLGVVGFTGAGKTTALRHYYSKTKNVYYLVGKKSMRPKRFFSSLLKQMGVQFMGTIGDMIDRIALELNKQSNSLLIIDEAGKLDQNMYMYLHDLRDETMYTSGIILAGVEYFKSNLEKAVDKQKQGMPEFMGRINAWQELDLPKKHEARAICEANGLTEKKVIDSLQNIKDFRRLANQIINAKMQLEIT